MTASHKISKWIDVSARERAKQQWQWCRQGNEGAKHVVWEKLESIKEERRSKHGVKEAERSQTLMSNKAFTTSVKFSWIFPCICHFLAFLLLKQLYISMFVCFIFREIAVGKNLLTPIFLSCCFGFKCSVVNSIIWKSVTFTLL